jgi:hypothetical protein
MGIVNPYFPKEISLQMAAMAGAEVFIETGTYYGGTTLWAATEFKEVHTIELSEYLYNYTKKDFLSKGNITSWLGDSRAVLPEILKTQKQNLVFWLDGHYSAGVTAGGNDPCPLLRELEIILARENDDIIIIDDARCCAGDEGWPTIVELYNKIEEVSKRKKYTGICDDHIYIIPDEKKYREALWDYILKRSIRLWNLSAKQEAAKHRIRNLGILFLKKIRLYNPARRTYRKIRKKA